MHAMTRDTPPHKPALRVGVLNAWGRLRSWIAREYAYGGMQEALSGMPVEVTFLSFADILSGGVPAYLDVLINTGDEGTAWSGGHHWRDPVVVTRIREFIRQGGGFLGVGEPSAAEYQGRFFQLMDLLGVDREVGLSKGKSKCRVRTETGHFILEDQPKTVDLGYLADFVYPWSEATQVLLQDGQGVRIAANQYGRGRSVYLAGFKFSWENVRLLTRALHWAAGKETELNQWFCSNLYTECGAFPQTGKCIVMNNTDRPQATAVFDDRGRSQTVELAAQQSKWIDIASFRCTPTSFSSPCG
jgi:1,3-beta-galactosyl-N-acetylhexosamine phosphorylase